MYRVTRWVLTFVMCAAAVPAASAQIHAQSSSSSSLDAIIGEIRALEGAQEPKCYATASRLEDFLYGTPLSDEARFRKNDLHKELVRSLWAQAAGSAPAVDALSGEHILPRTEQVFSYRERPDGNTEITRGDDVVVITATDRRQYASIAYALRAVLALQQDLLLAPDTRLPPLDDSAVDALKDFVDLYTLAALQVAERRARLDSRSELSVTNLESSWATLEASRIGATAEAIPAVPAPGRQASDFTVIQRIIEQKVESYAEYNQVANTIFVRNLQVYWARLPWPADGALGARFRDYFVQALVTFASDLWTGAEAVARGKDHALIRVEDVNDYAHYFIPHEINEYEDALFFPRLQADQRVAIESYDMDAFRDSGTHWRYLQFARRSVTASERCVAA